MKPKQIARHQQILPSHVHQRIEIHNGRSWVKLRPNQEMIGLKYGEFAKTRTPRSLHKGKKGKKAR